MKLKPVDGHITFRRRAASRCMHSEEQRVHRQTPLEDRRMVIKSAEHTCLDNVLVLLCHKFPRCERAGIAL
jgi:hypothetical protein